MGNQTISTLGTSKLPFVIGGIFAYKGIYSRLHNKVKEIKYESILGIVIILFMIIVYGVIESLFVAIFTGIIFICFFIFP